MQHCQFSSVIFKTQQKFNMKTLVKSTFILILVFAMNATYAQSVRNVDDFSRIKVSNSVKVKLIKSDQPKVEFKMITGDEEDLITKVKDGQLIVKLKSGKMSWSSKSKAAVKVYYTNLSGVDVNAGASVKSEELIKTEDMAVDVSSGANADLEVEAQTIDADVSSGGKIKLEGSAKSGNYDVSSGANLNAKLMICDYVDADVSSGGRMDVHANKKLNADASSGGSIRYTGDVENVDTDSGWSGQIKRMR